MNRFFDNTLNTLIAFGYALLITWGINLTTGAGLEIYQTAAFMALALSVRHSPPPFKD